MKNTYHVTEDGEQLIVLTFSKDKPISIFTFTFKGLFI